MPVVATDELARAAIPEGRRVDHGGMGGSAGSLVWNVVHSFGAVLLIAIAALVAVIWHAVAHTLAEAIRYHLRRLLGVPDDWPRQKNVG
jgi:hypothetical protein